MTSYRTWGSFSRFAGLMAILASHSTFAQQTGTVQQPGAIQQSGAIQGTGAATVTSVTAVAPPCIPAQPEGTGLHSCSTTNGYYAGATGTAASGTTLLNSVPAYALFPLVHTQLASTVEDLYTTNPASSSNWIRHPSSTTAVANICAAAPVSFWKSPEVTVNHVNKSCGPTSTLRVSGTTVHVSRAPGQAEDAWINGTMVSAFDHYFNQVQSQIISNNLLTIPTACQAPAVAYQNLLASYMATVRNLAKSRPTVDVPTEILKINPSDPNFAETAAQANSPAYLALASVRNNVEQAFVGVVSCVVMTQAQNDWENKTGSPSEVKAMIMDMNTRMNDCCSSPDGINECYQRNVALVARAQSEACYPLTTPDPGLVGTCVDPNVHNHPCPTGAP